MVVDAQAVELAVQCGPTDAQGAGCSRHIAIAQSQGPPDGPSFGLEEVSPGRTGYQDFRGRKLSGNSLVRNRECQASSPGCTDHKVVAVHGQQGGRISLCGITSKDYAGIGKMLAERLGFDRARSVGNGSGDEAQYASGCICPAR